MGIDFDKHSAISKLAEKKAELYGIIKISLDKEDGGIEIVSSFQFESEAIAAVAWLTDNRPIIKGGYIINRFHISKYKGDKDA